MYTIKRAAELAGVGVATLRAWERRYGVVHPARTSGGYRVYDDEAVARLRAMRRLMATGWSASNAAAEVIARGASSIEQEHADRAGAGQDASDGETAFVVGSFVGAAAALDPAAIDAAIDEMFARGSFERVAERYLFPALRELGDAWAKGTVSVAGEHAASHAVVRRLAAAFDAAGRPANGHSDVIVGLPPGGRHEIGALAFATALRRAGVSVTYLGADLPLEDWLHAASMARAAAISCVTPADRPHALAVADALTLADPGLIVAIGGAAAPAGTPHMTLAGGLGESVSTLVDALSANATR